MPDGLLIELGFSLAGVGLLVGLSYVLGAWRSARVTLAAAAERLGFDEPDFQPTRWLVGADEKAAAALSADGAEIGLVFAMGDDFATRRLKRANAKVEREGAALLFLLREPSRRAVRVEAPDEKAAEDWLLRLRSGEV